MLPAAQAAEPPKLKEGLWDIRGERVENPGAQRTEFAYKLCRDRAYDKAAEAALKGVKGCTTILKKLGSGEFASASRCAADGMIITSNGLSTYQGDTAVHSETHAAYTPPFNGKTDETLTEDQHYLGKCPAAMKPGDRIAPDGIVRHHDP